MRNFRAQNGMYKKPLYRIFSSKGGQRGGEFLPENKYRGEKRVLSYSKGIKKRPYTQKGKAFGAKISEINVAQFAIARRVKVIFLREMRPRQKIFEIK